MGKWEIADGDPGEAKEEDRQFIKWWTWARSEDIISETSIILARGDFKGDQKLPNPASKDQDGDSLPGCALV